MRVDLLIASAALALWIGGGSWFWVCQIKGHCDEVSPATASAVPLEVPAEAVALPGPGFFVGSELGNLFTRGETLLSPIGTDRLISTPGIDKAIDSLYFRLQADGSFLEVTGAYLEGGIAGETSQLGLQRAQAIGNLLLSQGFSSERMVYSYAPADHVSWADSMISAGKLRLLPAQVEISEEEKVLLFEPRNLYFSTGSAELPLDDSIRTYCADAIQYLRFHPEAMIAVTGHTDNVGSAANNKALGLDRANTVGGILTSFGFPESQLRVSSQGAESPIAVNSTQEGRSKNRRVEVRLFTQN